MWGSNKNYTLALGNEEGRPVPQQLDWFGRQKKFVTKVALSTFHCLYLAADDHTVYSVGHGCQLGIGAEGTLVVPKAISIPLRKKDHVIDISAGRNHSLVLTARNQIFSCGLNNHGQLGYAGAERQMKFKEVRFVTGTANHQPMLIGKINGILAKECHSVAYSDTELFAWGVNGGQFGFNVDLATVVVPLKLETFGHTIRLVDSSDAAIACYTAQNSIILYYQHKIRSIKTPTYERIKSITLYGGHLLGVSGYLSKSNELRMIAITDSGAVYLWHDNARHYVRCRLPLSEYIDDGIRYNGSMFMYLAKGDVFVGAETVVPIIKMGTTTTTSMDDYQELLSYRKDVLCTTREIVVNAKRVPNINGVTAVFCDPEFQSFIALQVRCEVLFI